MVLHYLVLKLRVLLRIGTVQRGPKDRNGPSSLRDGRFVATVSIPSASPLTITTPWSVRVFAMRVAVVRPRSEAFLDPIIAARGFGRGIFIGPAVKIFDGAYFLSTSLSGPKSCRGLTVVIL